MLYQILYTETALEDLESLPRPIAQRIAKKVKWFSEQNNPLQFAKSLHDTKFGQYRFRVGDYRIIFDINPRTKNVITILVILRVKHRREVYRNI